MLLLYFENVQEDGLNHSLNLKQRSPRILFLIYTVQTPPNRMRTCFIHTTNTSCGLSTQRATQKEAETTASWASYGTYFTPASPCSSNLETPGSPYSGLKAVATILPRRVGFPYSCLRVRLLLHVGVGRSTHSCNAGEAHLPRSCLQVRLLLPAGAGRLRIGEVTHLLNAGEALGAQCARDVLLRLLEMQGFVSPGRVRLSSVVSAP